jgi:hypothetical protein
MIVEVLTLPEVQSMPPAHRERFAAWCRRLADLADPRRDVPKTGVLSGLRVQAQRVAVDRRTAPTWKAQIVMLVATAGGRPPLLETLLAEVRWSRRTRNAS